ncbi:hypothetical protein SAMD00019534_045100 [Acytostelium subglobosum LB1]|uniref:hypothetical protein n=1 Tax=Acytostelium subglobosum LB1 TaxID=1410327 RepID=UPI000644B6F5|nr:hypothetical protein SAMD00019534_045100 [Acytostelium subglobosum LB1]GAM21335.1 hypothetical protein SAMD00019534_045100 [Acytostelium subglobosum LB1]|eukprot:XP_012755454.1 hypothetical protein SAMD00019534_045100 [Acytostelium subglobosum LB1]
MLTTTALLLVTFVNADNCICMDNRAYCGSHFTKTCGLNSTDLYQCVTRGQPPVRRFSCPNGCHKSDSQSASDTCVPDDISCTCPDNADHCGSVLAKQSGKDCASLDPNSLYQCEGEGLFPSWRWTCSTGCISNGPGVNDTCDKGASNVVGLTKIKHIVIFMQENRAFDNYYGILGGVCNYKDPNAMVQDNGNSIFYQPDPNSPDKHNGVNSSLPWMITGPKAGCTLGGSNFWQGNHDAWNNGSNNNWPVGNTPNSLGYLAPSNLPFYYELASQFTIADKYFESIMGSTNPNRLVLWTEILEKAGITWRVYQDIDNFDDNALEWFEQYQKSTKMSPLRVNGIDNWGLDSFFGHAMNGTLPQISWVVGPTELSEHPDNGPMAGQWLTQQVVNAIKNGSSWEDTVLIINYDETGGFWDHYPPPVAPIGTLDEWINVDGAAPIGPGYRVPAFIVSPWSSGSVVFTEPSDHTSVIMFIEQWAMANGYSPEDVMCPYVSTYRRNHMSDLTRSLDFSQANLSVPDTTPMPMPSRDPSGSWDPTEECEAVPGPFPTIPYGNQTFPVVEPGFKLVRGNNPGLGRTYVFQSGAQALIQNGKSIAFGPPSPTMTNPVQYFTMTMASNNNDDIGDNIGYRIVANNGRCLSGAGQLVKCDQNADNWFLLDLGNSEGFVFYNIPKGEYLQYAGTSFFLSNQIATTFAVYSV